MVGDVLPLGRPCPSVFENIPDPHTADAMASEMQDCAAGEVRAGGGAGLRGVALATMGVRVPCWRLTQTR